MSSKKNIEVPIKMSQQRIVDILTNGIEGGTSYWALWDNTPGGIIQPPKTVYSDFQIDGRLNNDDSPLNGAPFAVLVMYDGSIDVYDAGEPDDKLGTLTLPCLIRALGMMAAGKDMIGKEFPKRHFAAILDESDDAETADVLIQLAVMGEIVYG